MTDQLRTDQPLMGNRLKMTKTIAAFWDKVSEGWRTICGPHIHHGYYDNESISLLQAQENLIKKLAQELPSNPKMTILDVGCGMGGSSLYLAKHHQAIVTGITLSQQQVMLATQQAIKEQITTAFFKIEDALSLSSIADNSFDIVWSLESCEQFYDKALFIQQAYRVLKPGGKLILATWCSDRDVYVSKQAEKYRKLCYALDLPYMPTVVYYETHLTQHAFNLEKTLDWTNQVKKSWDIGLTLMNAYSFYELFKMIGWRAFRAAKQIQLMRDGFHENRIIYGVFIASK